jgi:hypothetical protein
LEKVQPVARGRKKKADTDLILALACGAAPESAAQKAGLSVRTVYRRLALVPFREQVDQVRAEMVRRAAGMFTAAGMASIKTFTSLLESATSEAVRLGAARALIELGCKLRKDVDLFERMAALEGRLESILASPGPPVPTCSDMQCSGSEGEEETGQPPTVSR